MENKQKSSNEAHSEPLQQCNVSGSYDKGIHLDWWNNEKTDRFAMLKKYGSNKGIYLIYTREQNG